MTIVTCLSGGLGNQLFQYAAGRALADRLGRPLAADLSWFESVPPDSTPRVPMLQHLRVELPAADPAVLALPRRREPRRWWQRLRLRPLPHGVAQLYVEREPFRFDPRLQHTPARAGVIVLQGYWQSFRYLEPIRGRLLDEVRPRHAPGASLRDVAAAIDAAAEPVMLHVRRGDYVGPTSASAVHGALPLRYYERALHALGGRVRRPTLFVFSDDPRWVRHHLPTPFETVWVGPEDGHDAGPASVVHELDLMRRCRHHVIANSSLSWWGAWLGTHAPRTVVAPSVWLHSRRVDLRDLMPPDWLIVDAT